MYEGKMVQGHSIIGDPSSPPVHLISILSVFVLSFFAFFCFLDRRGLDCSIYKKYIHAMWLGGGGGILVHTHALYCPLRQVMRYTCMKEEWDRCLVFS